MLKVMDVEGVFFVLVFVPPVVVVVVVVVVGGGGGGGVDAESRRETRRPTKSKMYRG